MTATKGRWPIPISELRQMIESRVSTREIARRLGVAHTTIYKATKTFGIKVINTRGGPRNKSKLPGKDKLQEHIDDGLSLAAIGAIYGIKDRGVSYWLKKHGLRPAGRDGRSLRYRDVSPDLPAYEEMLPGWLWYAPRNVAARHDPQHRRIA